MKKIIRQTLTTTIILAALCFDGALTAAAQHGYRVEKRITFKRGQVATSVKGTISSTLEGHDYVFRARKGQTLNVSLLSAKKGITFFITTPGGETLNGETALKKWYGELPEDGEYHLIIGTDSKGAARYTLQIQIATDI